MLQAAHPARAEPWCSFLRAEPEPLGSLGPHPREASGLVSPWLCLQQTYTVLALSAPHLALRPHGGHRQSSCQDHASPGAKCEQVRPMASQVGLAPLQASSALVYPPSAQDLAGKRASGMLRLFLGGAPAWTGAPASDGLLGSDLAAWGRQVSAMTLADEELTAGERAQCGSHRRAWLRTRAWLIHKERNATTVASEDLNREQCPVAHAWFYLNFMLTRRYSGVLGYTRCIFQDPYLLHVAARRHERASVAHVRLLGVGTDGHSCTGVGGAVGFAGRGASAFSVQLRWCPVGRPEGQDTCEAAGPVRAGAAPSHARPRSSEERPSKHILLLRRGLGWSVQSAYESGPRRLPTLASSSPLASSSRVPWPSPASRTERAAGPPWPGA